VSIEHLKAHWGLSRTPFTKELAPSMLYASQAHQQAVARISWCIEERALGLVTGEVGSGKSVAARAAVAGLDSSRHTVIYVCSQPGRRRPRHVRPDSPSVADHGSCTFSIIENVQVT
jgi:type II secretory pathway predicted ATPase ExeA